MSWDNNIIKRIIDLDEQEKNKMKRIIYILILIAITISNCTTPIIIPTTSANSNLLVVEGIINAGSDSTIITLSRTVLVSAKTTVNPETKATITVENATATVGTLTETVKGTYASKGLNLDITKQYRLRIKTSNGKTYASDLATPKITPPIDSLGYNITGTGLQIYVNAHDATNNTRYYRYDYRETWQFHAAFQTGYISNGTALLNRTPAQDIYSCFASDTTSNTILNSTAALSQDVVYQFPIVSVVSSAEKIEQKYSILVQQVALTKDAYTFWDNLKKNTEELGGIFDAQPSSIAGNIHNVNDATEPVIGYVSVGTVQKKRIYITRGQLPRSWALLDPYGCMVDTALINPPKVPNAPPEVRATLIVLPPQGYAIFPFADASMNIIGYMYTVPICADCTLRGTKTQPIFWK